MVELHQISKKYIYQYSDPTVARKDLDFLSEKEKGFKLNIQKS